MALRTVINRSIIPITLRLFLYLYKYIYIRKGRCAPVRFALFSLQCFAVFSSCSVFTSLKGHNMPKYAKIGHKGLNKQKTKNKKTHKKKTKISRDCRHWGHVFVFFVFIVFFCFCFHLLFFIIYLLPAK